MPVMDWLRWSAASIVLLNVVAMVLLVGAYAWHHRVKPKLAHRRARQHAFERLIACTSLDNQATMPAPNDADDCQQW